VVIQLLFFRGPGQSMAQRLCYSWVCVLVKIPKYECQSEVFMM